MVRSFTDRVLGGVCGGIAARLPLNAWVIRAVFIVLTVVTLGAFAVLYLMLWTALPQETLAGRTAGGTVGLLLTLALMAAVTGGWVAQLNGLTRTADGTDLYYPLLGLLLSLVFFGRQLGRSA